MKIVAICGAGIGTSGILKVNAERVLQRLGIKAMSWRAISRRSPPRPRTPR